MRKAFCQILLSEEYKEKTAFSTIGRDQFQFTTLPFGLFNATSATKISWFYICCSVSTQNFFLYRRYIVVTGSSFEEHVKLLEIVRDKGSKSYNKFRHFLRLH